MEDTRLSQPFQVSGRWSEIWWAMLRMSPNGKLGALTVSCLLLLLPACDLTGPETADEPNYVVESYQVAGEVLSPVYLSRTASLEESYDFSDLAISGARMQVERLTGEGAVDQTVTYRELAGSAGVYVPEDSATVQPLTRYRLTARLPDADHLIEAETTVPDTFSVLSTSADTVAYQGGEQLFVRFTRSKYPGRQEVFQYTSEAARPWISRLTPFYRDVAPSDSLEMVQEYRKTSSPLVNGANYGTASDPVISLRMPWLMFAFYGPNEIRTQAVDENLYDFLRSQAVQQGGPTTLGPGEIPSILEHVDGGTGVFGSYARVSVRVYVRPPQ